MSSQDYSFLSTATKKIQRKEYIDYLDANFKKSDSIQKKVIYFFEDGSIYNQKKIDSILLTKDGYRYATAFYKDTISNQFSFVLHKRSKQVVKESNKDFNDFIDADNKNRKKLKNTTIEGLVLKDIASEIHDLKKIQSIVVLDFWFINCSACVKEIPELNLLKNQFENEDIKWFAITYDSKEKVVNFLERFTFDFTIIPNSRHITDQFNIRFYPTTLILDQNRKVVYTGKFGFMKGRVNEIKEELSKLIKQNQSTVKVGPIIEIEKE
jgi:peroxiredoxin